MAVTKLVALRRTATKTIAQTIKDRIDYYINPEKTQRGEYVSSYGCSPQTAATEFLLSKQEYAAITGKNQGSKDRLLYHIRQSFKPGEITPELANKLGYELAMRFTKGRHGFIVATHIDKKHIHNHIVFNSTTLDCTRKFDDPYNSGMIIRRISDQICVENGLSIVENPKPSKGHYGTWLGDKKKPSYRDQLKQEIDAALDHKPANYEEFLKLIQAAGFEVKLRGRRHSFRGIGKGFITLRSLKGDYTEDAIKEIISGKRTRPKRKNTPASTNNKLNLLIDIQNSIKAQNSPGYAQWSKIFNLKVAASTLIFLQENSLDDIDKLNERAQRAKDEFNGIKTQIQNIDLRLKEISSLQKHIGTYSKTREIYSAYRKSGYSKKYLAKNGDSIAAHKAAKKYFDSLGLEKLPTISKLKAEYGTISAEKKKLYADYHPARKYMQDVLSAQQNVRQLLNYSDAEKRIENERT